MTTLPQHKRGDSFALYDCQLLDDLDSAVNLADIQIRCQIRSEYNGLLDEAQIVKHSADLYYDVIFGDSNGWPLGNAKLDIQYTDSNSKVFSSDTLIVPIVADVTRPAE